MNKAKWITSEEFSNLNILNVFKRTRNITVSEPDKYADSHLLYRKKILLDDFKKIIVHISADDYYKLYINGALVSQGPPSGYYFHYYFDEVDITKYCRKGINTIAVHQYYQGLVNRVWVSGDHRCGLFFELYQDNNIKLVSDETWKVFKSRAYIKNKNIYGRMLLLICFFFIFFLLNNT